MSFDPQAMLNAVSELVGGLAAVETFSTDAQACGAATNALDKAVALVPTFAPVVAKARANMAQAKIAAAVAPTAPTGPV